MKIMTEQGKSPARHPGTERIRGSASSVECMLELLVRAIGCELVYDGSAVDKPGTQQPGQKPSMFTRVYRHNGLDADFKFIYDFREGFADVQVSNADLAKIEGEVERQKTAREAVEK